MKRITAILAGLCICLCAFAACTPFSETEYAVVGERIASPSGYIYDKYENSTVRITGMDNIPAVLQIPDEIDGMPVVEICDNAFSGSNILLHLEFPDKELKLGKNICYESTSLVSVKLSTSIKSIPSGMFTGCRNLSTIEGTDGITEIGTEAFADCSSLSEFKFGNKLTSIGEEAFRGCSSLSAITLPDSIESIGKSAFWSCSSLSKLTVDSPVAIPESAFLDCRQLANVTLGDKVTEIGKDAFRGCTSLDSIYIGLKISNIGEYAFFECDAISLVTYSGKKQSITIGDGNECLQNAQGGVK